MANVVERVDVWVAGMKDKPGALAEKLAALSEARANLVFIVARRDKPGAGVVFVTPISGPAQLAAARKAGFKKTKSLHSVKLEGANKAGLGARATAALAGAGINLHGVSGAAIGRKAVLYFAFDNAADATKAIRLLKGI